MKHGAVLLRISVVLLAAGCANIDLGTAALRDAADALECPEAAMTMEQLGEYRYHGRGCDEEVTVACTAANLEPRCYPEGSGGQTEEEIAAAPPEVESVIRAGLDARRDDVLGCVGLDRVGVRVVYGEDGEVDITLQGELAESPEEACVRDVLDGVRVAATGEEGVIIHLVD